MLELRLGAARGHAVGAPGEALGEQPAVLRVAIEAFEPEAAIDLVGGGGLYEFGAVVGDQAIAVGLAEGPSRHEAAAQDQADAAVDFLRPLAEVERGLVAALARLAQPESAVGEQRDDESGAREGARRIAGPAGGVAAHRPSGRRQRRLAAATAEFVVGVAVGEARAGTLARQLDLGLACDRERGEVAVLGELGAEIGGAGADIPDLRSRRLAFLAWRGRCCR